jgi:hypothetical protein
MKGKAADRTVSDERVCIVVSTLFFVHHDAGLPLLLSLPSTLK